MEGKGNIICGTIFILIQLTILFEYQKSGCISLPRVPELCGETAQGPFIALFLLIAIGIYCILTGISQIKRRK